MSNKEYHTVALLLFSVKNKEFRRAIIRVGAQCSTISEHCIYVLSHQDLNGKVEAPIEVLLSFTS